MLDRSIGIISTLVLARLLVPDDFGLVAMASATVGMLELLGAFNLDVALIQRTTATRAHYDTVWTFNVLFGVCCGIGFALLAVPASSFYREPRLEQVMYVLGFAQAVSGFTNVAVVDFRKEMRFHACCACMEAGNWVLVDLHERSNDRWGLGRLGDSWIRLSAEIAFGALAYVISVLALWFASGRPNGAESFSLD